MSFFQQIEPNSAVPARTLLKKMVLISLLAHGGGVCALFLADVFFGRQALVMGFGRGARVSMESRRGRGSHVEPVTQAKEETKPVPAEMKKSETKKEPTIAKQSKVEKKSAEPVETIPSFSALEKKFTQLKKPKKAAEEVKPVAPKAAAVSELKKKEEDKPAEKSNVKPPVAQPVSNVLPSNSSFEKSGNQSSVSSGEPERLEFDTDEGAGSDNVIVQEIEHHYRRPPGFDDHESFVFTFEMKNGKAIAVAPRGSEPLVLYSAIKDAVLRSSFPVYKQSKKIELLIKS